MGAAQRFRTCSSAAGTTLLECLGYIAMLGILINLAAGLFVTCMRLNGYGTDALDRIAAREELREGFVDTVREATRVINGIGPYRTSPDCVVLALPRLAGAPLEGRYAVLGPIRTNSRLTRLVVRKTNGVFEPEY